MDIIKQLFHKLLELFLNNFIIHGALLVVYDTTLNSKNSWYLKVEESEWEC